MQWTRAQWFRDVCWAMVVWFCVYGVHAVALAEESLRSALQSLGPAVAYAQEPNPTPQDTSASVLSVAHTLSTVTVAGVQNNQLTITYTIFNLQAEPVTGILLVTTLQPDVTFQSASPLPDRNG